MVGLIGRLMGKGKTVRASIRESYIVNPIGDASPAGKNIGELRSDITSSYHINPWVHSAINQISAAAAGIRPVLKDNRGRDLENTHPLKMLFDNPNPRQTYSEFTREVYSTYTLTGNAYIFKQRGSSGKIVNLWCLLPKNVKVVPNPESIFEPVKHYLVGKNQLKVDVDDMIHLKTFNPSSEVEGLSPLNPLLGTLEQDVLIDMRNSTILHNEGKPRLKYTIPADSNLMEEEVQQIMANVSHLWDPENAGGVLFLDGGNEAEEMFTRAVDIDFLEGAKFNMRKVCAVLAMPPEKLGDGENKTFANAMEANRSFADSAVIPLVQMLFQALHKTFHKEYSDVETITYSNDDVKNLRGDESEKFQAVSNCRFLSINEQREMLGYERWDDDADNIILVGGMVTLSDVAEGLTSTPSHEKGKEMREKKSEEEAD